MDLRQLKYVIAVAEEATFIGAANRACTSQPALSRQIRALEQELGITLFERGPRGVILTPAGDAVLASARLITNALTSAIRQARASSEGLSGSCTITTGPRVLVSGKLARIVEAVQSRYPGIDLIIQEASFERQWDAISAGRSDLGLGIPAPPRYKEIESERLTDDIFDCAAVAASHPLARAERISLRDLADETILTWSDTVAPAMAKALEAELHAAGVRPRRREFQEHYPLLTAVRAGQGWALLSAGAAPLLGPDARVVPLDDCRVVVPHSLLRRRDESRPLVSRVAQIVRSVICEDDPLNRGRSCDVEARGLDNDMDAVLNQIELRHLRYFVCAVNAGSFGRAAEQLGITQPALSRQIRELEFAVGLTLLERESRGATATAAGRLLSERLYRVMELVEAIPREARRAERGLRATCVIGGVPTLAVQRVFQELIKRSQAPVSALPEITLIDVPTPHQPDAVREGTIDIGIGHSTPLLPAAEAGIQRLSLLNDRMNRALIPAHHDLAGRPLLELRDLAALPFLFLDRATQPALYDQVYGAFTAREFEPLVCGTYDGLQTVWALVAQGRGWGIGFESQRDEPPAGTVAIPIDDFSLPFGVQAIWRAGDERASVRRVLDSLSEIASRSSTRSNAMAAILLVENDADLRRVLERGLQQAGHMVTAPADSVTAAQLIESTSFDLVITDILMPDIEGLDIIRRIRTSQPDFKVIAISGGGLGSSGQYLEMARRFGADETLEKPFRIQELIAAVDRALAS